MRRFFAGKAYFLLARRQKGQDMARRGRKRKLDVNRQGNGQPSRAKDCVESVIPDAALDRRAEATGMSRTDKMLTKVDASSALGILHQRGILGTHHYDAGKKLAEAHKRWACSAAARPRTARVAGIFGPDDRPPPREVEGDEWARIKARFTEAKASVPRGLCWALVECVVMDNVVAPNMVERGELCDKIRAELVRGMDALCRYFNISIPEKDDSSKAA